MKLQWFHVHVKYLDAFLFTHTHKEFMALVLVYITLFELIYLNHNKGHSLSSLLECVTWDQPVLSNIDKIS